MLTTAIRSAVDALKPSPAPAGSDPAAAAVVTPAAATAAASPAAAGKAVKAASAAPSAGKGPDAVGPASAAAAAAGGVGPSAAAAGAIDDALRSCCLSPTAAMLPVVESKEVPSDLLGWAFWAPATDLAAKLAADAGPGSLAAGGLGVPVEVPLSCCRLVVEELCAAGLVLHGLPVAQLMRMMGSVSLRNEVSKGLFMTG